MTQLAWPDGKADLAGSGRALVPAGCGRRGGRGAGRGRLGGGAGDGGVDGELVFVPVVDGAEVEEREEPFDEGARGVGDDVAEVGHFVQEAGSLTGSSDAAVRVSSWLWSAVRWVYRGGVRGSPTLLIFSLTSQCFTWLGRCRVSPHRGHTRLRGGGWPACGRHTRMRSQSAYFRNCRRSLVISAGRSS